MVMKICNFDNCAKQQPKLTRGWCSNHYQRWRRYGNPAFTKNDVRKPKKCGYCGVLFMPKRLSTAITCSGKCSLKKWRREHPEHNQMIKREWRKRNPGREIEGHKRWLKRNPEKVAHHKAIRYAREHDANGSHTLKEWDEIKEKFNNLCAGCFKPKFLTRDHIHPLSKGGSNYIDNIQPLCRSCNSRKNNKEFVCL